MGNHERQSYQLNKLIAMDPVTCFLMNLLMSHTVQYDYADSILLCTMTPCALPSCASVPLVPAQPSSATDLSTLSLQSIQSLLRATVQACAHNESTW